ncbi:hypothetical protein Vi05172_g2373 [Venturia inaequalis]|nr:hypothetical protein Vi05172_g2373 [Venturia inaequalis]
MCNAGWGTRGQGDVTDEAEQDFQDETRRWLVRNFNLTAIPARSAFTPGNDANSCGTRSRVETLDLLYSPDADLKPLQFFAKP